MASELTDHIVGGGTYQRIKSSVILHPLGLKTCEHLRETAYAVAPTELTLLMIFQFSKV